MSRTTYLDLDECTEFRQSLRSQTPRIVHGTVFLLIVLLATGITWMALTEANLVVGGTGRVRPVSFRDDAPDDLLSHEASSQRDGRVTEICAKVGDEVASGAVLVRLETTELGIQIEQLQTSIAAGEKHLDELDHSLSLLRQRYLSAAEKAQAELNEALVDLELAGQRRESNIALAQIALSEANDKAARARELAARGVLVQEALVEAVSRSQQAEQKLHEARLPVNDGKAQVLQRSLELIERDYAVELQNLALDRRAKQDELDGARFDLIKLQFQKQHSEIRAPFDCIVTQASVKVGDMIRRGKIGIVVARRSGFEFEVEVSNADVAHLRVDMPVQIKIDALDYQKYGTLSGTVRFVAPDSTHKTLGDGKQLAIYNVQVALDQDELLRGDHRGRIKLGMTGRAEIVTDRESILLILIRKMRQRISLG